MTQALILCATVVAMEFGAGALHRFVMHGWGWNWHQSHHRRTPDLLQKNDLYAVLFAFVAVALFWATPGRGHWMFWVAAGMTTYGMLYFILHDGLVHRRWPAPTRPTNRYLQRLIQAHRLHHATFERDGAVSFGFLYAPPVRVLVQRMRQSRAAAGQ